jgi:hypothetical protein
MYEKSVFAHLVHKRVSTDYRQLKEAVYSQLGNDRPESFHVFLVSAKGGIGNLHGLRSKLEPSSATPFNGNKTMRCMVTHASVGLAGVP